MTKVIAWIDDDCDRLHLVMRPLRKLGYVIQEYQTANEALEALDEIVEVDLILLDLILPSGQPRQRGARYGGIDLLRKIRTRANTPVVVLSVVRREDVLEVAKELGVNAIIQKPVTPIQLKAGVEDVLAKSP